MSRIEVFSNTLGVEEWKAVKRVFKSRWLGMGEECAAFEYELAEYWGVAGHRLPLLLNSCTAGLQLALKAIGIGEGDHVIVPSIHFVACEWAIRSLGAVPVYVDVDPRSLNVTAKAIEEAVTGKTQAVLLLHYGGHPCDMDPIREVCGVHGLRIVEDAANAVASAYHGRACGTLGDAGAWSFDSMKVLVTADGGALWIRDTGAYHLAKSLRNLGLSHTSGTDNLEKGQRARWWEYGVVEPWGRADSNDLLAAIGREQLRKLPRFIERRAHVWKTYQTELAGVGDLVLPPEPLPGCTSTYYLYWVQTEKRDELARRLIESDVYCTFRYYPLHLAMGTGQRLPGAEHAAERTLCLPIHQNLSDDDVAWIVKTIKGFYHRG